MNAESTPAAQAGQMLVPTAELAALAIEHWRLSRCFADLPASNTSAQARHALRKMADALMRLQIEARSFEGHPFDPGLAVRVVDTIDDPTGKSTPTTIIETVSPQILWKGQVIKPADVVTTR